MTVEELLDSLADQIKAKVISIEEAEKQLGRAHRKHRGYAYFESNTEPAYDNLCEAHNAYDRLSLLDQNIREQIVQIERISQPLGLGSVVVKTLVTSAQTNVGPADANAPVYTQDIPF